MNEGAIKLVRTQQRHYSYPLMIEFFLGIALALFTATIAPLLVDWRLRVKKRDTIRGALQSEIAAILDIAQRRDYLGGLQAEVKALQEGKNGSLSFSVTQDFFAVFHSQLAEIGLLPRTEAERVVRFYTLLKAVVEDATEVHCGRRNFTSHHERLVFFTNFHNLLKEALEEGTALAENFEKA